MTIVLLAAVALLIRVGQGWYSAAIVRSKNAAGAVLRSVADLAVAVLAFWAVGMAIFNHSPGMLFGAKQGGGATQFVQLVLILIATAPVTGAIAERCRFFPMLVSPLLLAGVIVPVAGHWAWTGGWLTTRLGFFDVAGASVLHVTGGLAALAAAVVVGPRTGKYNRDGSSNFIPGHSMPMASVGVVLMLVGWTPYLLAAAPHDELAGRAALNVLLAGSSGAVTAMLLSNARYGKPDIMLTWSGLLGGLVAITGSGGLVSTLAAVAIGAVAGVLVPTLTVILDLVWKIDDPAGGAAIHFVGGAWGTLAAGLFLPSSGSIATLKQLGVQCVGLVAISALALIASFVVFGAVGKAIGLRLSEDAEYDGADLAEHDLNAYPDFQQTMIKSYHLREA